MISNYVSKTKNSGAFLPACVDHGYNMEGMKFNSESYKIPYKSSWTLSESLGKWVY